MRSLLVIAMLVYCAVSATAQVRPTTFEKKIVLSSTSIRIDSLLKVFSRQTGVEFSFNPTKVKPSKTLTVSRQQQTLSQWLTTLRQQVGIQHKVVGSHIILFDNGPATLAAGNKPGNRSSTTPPGKQRNTDVVPIQQKQKTVIVIDSSRTSVPDTAIHRPATDTVQAKSPVKQTASSKPTTPVSPAPTASQVHDTVRSTAPKPAKTARPATQPAASRVPDRSQPADDDEWADEAIQLIGGFAFHSSGDMGGLLFGTSYTRYLGHRFSLNLNLRGTIHDSEIHFSFPHPTIQGETVESSMRSTTAGVQLGVDAQLSVVRSRHHEVMFSLGGFGRYQTSSPDGYGAYSPLASGIPEVVFSMYNWNKQHTIAAGALLQLHYNFTFSNNLLLGIKAGMQTDTEGDLISQAGLSVGKRF